MSKFLSFDIEIAMSIPEGVEDWSALHPMGITCAATWASDEDKPRVWCGRDDWGSFAPRMGMTELAMLVAYMHNAVADGYQVVTLNGAGFDFRELAESSMLHGVCKEIAWGHCDLFYQVFCQLGYAPGLNAISQGMNCGCKTADVDGAKAPELWMSGQYGKVLEYVANDAKLTLDVAQAIHDAGEVRWTSKNGRPQCVNIEKLLSVREASLLTLPDNSWMSNPWTRSKFTGWLQ